MDWQSLLGLTPPKIKTSDLSYVPASRTDMGDYAGINQGNIALNGDYGDFNRLSPWSNDLQFEIPGASDFGQLGYEMDPNLQTFNALLKSGDKTGQKITYTRQGDEFVPSYGGQFGWDTNGGAMDYLPALMMGGMLAMPFIGPGAGAAAAQSGGFDGAALGGLGGVEPISYSGFTGATGGIGSLGSGWGSAGVVAGEGGAATLGGGATAGLGSAGGSLFDNVPAALQNPSNLMSLARLGGLLAGGALGSQGQEGGTQTATQQPVPTMYGGATNAPSWGPMGNTETERRMRKEYYPGLLGGQNPWGF